MSLIEYLSDQCLGIRTRARVGKGVKEDRKKTKPGKIVKNKKFSSESDLWYNRFRVNSSLGGQSDNSLNDTPKISRHFRKLKRKKLYCPKKHCVRIQIPRKGYFYRSTVRFKAPGSAPSMQRLESNVPKNKSKVQIPGLAPTNPKGTNLLKKRLKNQRKDSKVVPQSAGPPASCSSAKALPLGSAFGKQVLICNLAQKVPKGKLPHWPQLTDPPLHIPAVEPQNCAISSVTSDSHTTDNQVKRKRKIKSKNAKKLTSSRGTEDVAEVLETSSDKIVSISKSDIRTPPPSETSFDTLLNCISRVLGKDEGLYDLQITPVRSGGGESSLDDQTLAHGFQMPEIVTAFDNFCDINTLETDGIFLSPAASLTFLGPNEENELGFASEDNIARILIGEIDLHLELENYLRDIECFNGGKSRSKNTLQCNLYEDHCFPIESRAELQTGATEFYEVTEIKSNSTFESATSVCTQQDGDTQKLHVFLDRKHDMGSKSDERFDSRSTKGFLSQTQFTDKVGDIRKIKSDNEPKRIQQEIKLKSSIKRSFGKTSFQSFRPDEKSWILPPLRTNLSTDISVDSYEKIFPFGWCWNKCCDEVKKRNNLLCTNSVYSLSADSFPTTVKKSTSDSDRRLERRDSTQDVESDELSELEFRDKRSSNNLCLEGTPKLRKQFWSPSLQELIEIYNNVLKHNKRIRSNSRTSVTRCISSHLFSFLKEELKDKEYKANLIMLSRNLNNKLKAPEIWKPGRQKKDNTLEDYVAMFQEILKSSLSISQIARLNNIISGLQECSEKNYDLVKSLSEKKKKKKKKVAEEIERTETAPEPKRVKEKAPPVSPPKKPRKKLSIERANSPVKPSSEECQIRWKRSENIKPKPKTEELVPVKEITKVELTSPTELEAVLQSCIGAEDANGMYPRDPKDKILVTVKLHGNQVLVSKLSYFKNEEALSPGNAEQNGTSELIMERITKDQVKDVWQKKPVKNVKPKVLKKVAELDKPKTEKIVKAEPRRAKRNPKVATAKPASPRTPTTPKRERHVRDSHFFPKEPKGPKNALPFEYNQMQLRAQHPIEAIIESSESKISEHIENSDDDQSRPNLNPPLEKKVLLPNTNQSTTLEEALKEALAEKVYSKDLNCNFGWSDDKVLDKALGRTKSYVINRETLKEQTFAQVPLNDPETVRSLSDIVSKAKCKRKARRKPSAFMCYPSILNLQRKPPAVKKKSKKHSRQKTRFLCCSSPRIPSNCDLCPQKQGIAKRPSREFGSKILISEVETSQTSAMIAVQEDLERTAKKSLADSTTSDSEGVLDCCSMELLYYDQEKPSPDVTPKPSASAVKPPSKTASSEHLALPSEGKARSCSRSPSAITVGVTQGSPIVIHPPRNDSADTIFGSVLIHSDSFLKKSYSSLPLTQINMSPFLKTNSDMKFYPGRVSSADKQQSPQVKFVLTPSQNAEAELPPNQVQVIHKKNAAERGVVDHSEKERGSTASEESEEKDPLNSIEKFIKRLSKPKKKVKPKPKEPTKSDSEDPEAPLPASKGTQKKKFPLPGQKVHSKAPDRKPYHECQKLRLLDKTDGTEKKPKSEDAEAKAKEKKAKTAESKTKMNREKTEEDPLQKKSDMNFLTLKKFIATLSQMMESYENLTKEGVKNEAEGNSEKESGETSTKEEAAIVSDTDPETEGVSSEGHVEKGTNTIPEAKCSLTRVSEFAEDVSVKRVQAVKSAITQTEDVPLTKDGVEGEFERQIEKSKVGESCSFIPKVPAGATQSRKPKTLKIKIHCDERSNCRDDSKADKLGQNETKNPVAEKGKPQSLSEKVGLLDSLVMGEPEGGTLERRNSTYFDAIDKHSDDEGEGARVEERVNNSEQKFLAYWATVDPVNLSAGLVIKEGRSPSPGRTIPDDTPPEGVPPEHVLDEILRSLQDNKIYRTLTLLDNFLSKAECSPSWSADSDRLRNVLLLVNSKSKSLMTGMEKNAWMKVLSLLEDMSQIIGSEYGDSPKCFVRKIQGLNDRRLIDLQNFCRFLSQMSIRSNNRIQDIFRRVKDSFSYLRNRITLRRSTKSVHSRVRLAETPEALEPSMDNPEQSPLGQLRKQIQRQKTYIEFLLNADCSAVPHEVRDVKKKVLEKMRTFGEIFSAVSEQRLRDGGGPQRDVSPRGARSSFY